MSGVWPTFFLNWGRVTNRHSERLLGGQQRRLLDTRVAGRRSSRSTDRLTRACRQHQSRKELPTSQVTAISPGPHGWIPRAQVALDELSGVRTVAEVEVRFGSARQLTEEVLGFPVSGGHATRRAIRAVGRLIQHRLGPSLTAEALTWSASLASDLDSSTIEAFLEFTAESPGVYRPWRLGNPPDVIEPIRAFASPSSRRGKLCELWTHTRSNLHNPESDYQRDRQLVPFEVCNDGYDDLAAWLRDTSFEDDERVFEGMANLSPEQQRHLAENATPAEIDRLAQHVDLFEMDDEVVARCLLQSTRHTLQNPACSQEIRDRIRHPYDLATLELALLAGPECFERSRVCRMVAELDSESLRAVVAAEPTVILEGLRGLGLASADEILSGRLGQLDLQDHNVCRALFGDPETSNAIDVVSEVALRHPRAECLAWWFDDAPLGAMPAPAARRLIDLAQPSIAKAAMRHLSLDLLAPSDKECAARCGDAWLAACPGLTAWERPPLPLSRLGPGPNRSIPTAALVWYPQQLLELESTTFKQGPGWRVTLPRTADDIRHNAKVMRNCTASLIEDVLEGSLFLVIVHDPEGHRFNVAITKERDHFVVGHINSWANGRIEPPWIRTAFTRRLNGLEESAVWENQANPCRSPRPKRDRRRTRARIARQRRR